MRIKIGKIFSEPIKHSPKRSPHLAKKKKPTPG
jgi:hypothetical protein